MNIRSREIQYRCNEQLHKGYFAFDSDNPEARPGVVVIHEWWGVNDYVRSRADMLAELGYCAFAIDMFGDGKTAGNPDEAGAAMNAVLEDMTTGTQRLQAGYDTLTAQPEVDSAHTAAVGYCFGGAMALHMARIGIPIDAAVSFHGALGSFHKPEPGEVAARILVCHGGADAMVSMEDVEAFKQEMNHANADYRVIVHQGAQHGFTSKQATENGKKYAIPVGYDASADEESWLAMKKLFAECLD